MRIDDAGSGVEARVADAPDAHLAIVVRDVLEQPGDCIVHVVALAALPLGGCRLAVRGHFLPDAFGHIAAPHILAHEDVAGFFKFARWAQRFGQPVHAVAQLAFGAHAGAVRGALHQERVAARAVLRHVDDREQLHAVTHRDPVFVLGIGFARRALAVFGAVFATVGGNRGRRDGQASGKAEAENKGGKRAADHDGLRRDDWGRQCNGIPRPISKRNDHANGCAVCSSCTPRTRSRTRWIWLRRRYSSSA